MEKPGNFAVSPTLTIDMVRSLTYMLVCSFLASCAGGYGSSTIESTYVINKMQVPFFDTIGKVEVEASISQGFEFAAGYSFSDYLAAAASIRFKSHGFSSDMDKDSNNHLNRFFDVGVGY